MLILLALAMTPGTWLRTPVLSRDVADATVTPLDWPHDTRNGFALVGLWQVTGRSESFGGYSAMLLRGTIAVRLFSDKGWLLTIPRPDRPPTPGNAPRTRQIYPRGLPLVDLLDMESVTQDRRTGQYWVGYENRHTIYRYSRDGEPEAYAAPPGAGSWGVNSGIEAMVRLPDGRFLALRESDGEGLLYSGDPTAGGVPVQFQAVWPSGYAPTDMAMLPDGRVLILVRKVSWHVPPFEVRLMVGDPARIDAGQPWQPVSLLQVEDLLPRDNYEALAVEPLAQGKVTIWLGSDDNRSALQRSLLAKLNWRYAP